MEMTGWYLITPCDCTDLCEKPHTLTSGDAFIKTRIGLQMGTWN